MNPLYLAGWTTARLVFRIYFRAQYFNVQRMPASGPVILASNHLSFLDPPLIGAGLHREIGYLARESLFRYPVLGWLLREWGAVPIDREGSSLSGLKAILDQLAAGKPVLLFPEGTRSRDGQLQHARSGIGLAVIRSGVPVLPVRVFGTYQAYGRHHRFPRPKRVAMKCGRLLTFEALRTETQNCPKNRLKEIYQEVTQQIMAAIAALQPCEDKEEFP